MILALAGTMVNRAVCSVQRMLCRFPALLVALILLASHTDARAATVTNLRVTFQKGQAFITFQEVSGASIIYSVYRSTTAITSISGLAPVASIPQGSGTNKYTGSGFIITDLGAPLTTGTGLLVFTTSQDGAYYYAVTNSVDSTIVVGVNSTSAPVSESLWTTPGAVQIRAPYQDLGNWVYEYFAWDDYSSWEPSWGYYGSRFDVVTQGTLAASQKYPLTLKLHGAGEASYHEPGHYVQPANGIYLFPVDLGFLLGNVDPYTGSGRKLSAWFGYSRRSTTPVLALNVIERRVMRYTSFIAAEPRYQVDSTRVYVSGASMGGGGALHIAVHYPSFFAAAEALIGWVDTDAWGDWSDFAGNPPVNSPTGPLWKTWQDATWVIQNSTSVIPPIVHTFRKDDTIINETRYPALLQTTENKKYAHISAWQDGGHQAFGLGGASSYLRFKKDEAYPVFVASSNSTAFTSQTGQRNNMLDWGSSLRSLASGTGIVDTENGFAMSFASLSTDATADVTIRNTQRFRPQPGAIVSWTNVSASSGQVLESGSTPVDSAGLVSVHIRIPTSGNRLTLSCSGCTSTTPPPAAPTNVRVIR